MDLASKNRLLNNIEIEEGRLSLDSLPRRCILTLSTKCNCQCIMCEVKDAHWDMPAGVISEIMGLFPYLESIAWQGGEVFYFRGFEKIFNEARRFMNLKQTIVTNGLLLDEGWLEKINYANMELTVSIDGATKEVYEKIRKGANYELLRDRLNMISRMRKQRTDRMSFRMHTVIMKSNYKQIESFLELAKQNDFEAIHFIPVYGNLVPEENIFLDRDQTVISFLADKMKEVEEKARMYEIEVINGLPVYDRVHQQRYASLDNSNRSSEQLLCCLPWQQLNIDPGGEVRPGCLCSHSIGSVLNSSLKEIWNNELMQRYRRTIVEKRKDWCNQNCLNGKIPVELRKV